MEDKSDKAIKKEIRALFDPKEFRSFYQINVVRTFIDTVIIFSVVLSVVASVVIIDHFGGISWVSIYFPIGAFLMGCAINWINVQVHEASHYLLFKNREINDLYCNLILGCWALHDVQTYRSTHSYHHAYLHTEKDPDRDHYTSNVGSKSELLRGFMKDLLMVTTITRIFQVLNFSPETNNKKPKYAQTPKYVSLAKMLAQLVFLSIFISSAGYLGILYYAAFIMFPLFSVFPILIRIRTVIQHYDHDLFEAKSNVKNWVSRTTIASTLQHLIIGARMDYHLEHHLFPTIPYYQLKKMHFHLLKLGWFDQNEVKANLRTDDFVEAYVRVGRFSEKYA